LRQITAFIINNLLRNSPIYRQAPPGPVEVHGKQA
jgi:hypothetical protein